LLALNELDKPGKDSRTASFNAAVHWASIRLQHELASHPLASPAKEIVDSLLEPLRPKNGQDLKSFNEEHIRTYAASKEHRLAGLQARVLLDPTKKEAAVKEIVAAQEMDHGDVEQEIKVIEVLEEWGVSTEEFKKNAHKRWPEVTVFGSEKH
jgi:hypothetical protein